MPRADRTSPDQAPPATGTDRRPDRRSVRRKPTPPTVVVLVRHGTTTTTGRELPGRAPGLHLSEAGREQAERVAGRLAEMAGLRPDGTRSDADAGADPPAAGRRARAPAPGRRRASAR